jgi:hypothetical protein
VFSLTSGILFHANENLSAPSFRTNLDLSAPVLHFETEFLLVSVLTEDFGLVPNFFDLYNGGRKFYLTSRSIKVYEEVFSFGLRQDNQIIFSPMSHKANPPALVWAEGYHSSAVKARGNGCFATESGIILEILPQERSSRQNRRAVLTGVGSKPMRLGNKC